METGIKDSKIVATHHDVYMGKPANGLVWSGPGMGNNTPPSDNMFRIENGQKLLISSAFKRKTTLEKDRPELFYKTLYDNMDYNVTNDSDTDIFSWKTPEGNLTGKRHHNHFNEYPVKTVEDIDAWIYTFQNMQFAKNDNWFKNQDVSEIKSFGLNWSPVQQLIQFDIGLENFYYFLMDQPEKMQLLLDVMQERCVDRLKLGLSLFPNCQYVYWGENTSSSAISPDYYRQLTLPHIKAYAKLIHDKNCRLIVHMCGLLKNLLDCLIETGMDGIHSVTPPPLGDTPYDLIREKFPANFTIDGRFNAELWVNKSKAEIQNNLRKTIYPELLDTPFCLMVTDDAMENISYENVMTLYDALETFKP